MFQIKYQDGSETKTIGNFNDRTAAVSYLLKIRAKRYQAWIVPISEVVCFT